MLSLCEHEVHDAPCAEHVDGFGESSSVCVEHLRRLPPDRPGHDAVERRARHAQLLAQAHVAQLGVTAVGQKNVALEKKKQTNKQTQATHDEL